MNRIPITQTPGQPTVIAVAMDHPQPIIGPAPHSLGYIIDMTLDKLRAAVINGLVISGWIMAGLALLAWVWPTFEGWLEGFIVALIYALM